MNVKNCLSETGTIIFLKKRGSPARSCHASRSHSSRSHQPDKNASRATTKSGGLRRCACASALRAPTFSGRHAAKAGRRRCTRVVHVRRWLCHPGLGTRLSCEPAHGTRPPGGHTQSNSGGAEPACATCGPDRYLCTRDHGPRTTPHLVTTNKHARPLAQLAQDLRCAQKQRPRDATRRHLASPLLVTPRAEEFKRQP